MDNSVQVLYDSRKSLIHITHHCIASFLSTLHRPSRGLSQQALDNHVDNFAQALYDRAKCLIYNEHPCVD